MIAVLFQYDELPTALMIDATHVGPAPFVAVCVWSEFARDGVM